MKEVKDPALLKRYMDETDFRSHFSFPIDPMVKLFRAECGETIFEDYGINRSLVYMISGRAKLSHTLANGETTLIDCSQAPILFGDMEFLGLGNYTYEVRALQRCELLCIPLENTQDRLLKDPKFLLFLSLCLAQKERQKSRDLIRNSIYPLADRLAHYMIATCKNDFFSDSISDTAHYLGGTTRHLQRVVSDFIREGYLAKKKHGYQIINKEALRKIAEQVDVGILEGQIDENHADGRNTNGNPLPLVCPFPKNKGLN